MLGGFYDFLKFSGKDIKLQENFIFIYIVYNKYIFKWL